eukprot:gene28898-34873_t
MHKISPYIFHARATLTLGLPLIGSHVAQFVLHLTDTVMLGWYGVLPLAAGVLGASSFFTIFVLGSGFAKAVMPMVASANSQGDERQVRRVARMGLWLSILFSVLTYPVFWWSGTILLALGQAEEEAARLQAQAAELRQARSRDEVDGRELRKRVAELTLVLQGTPSAILRPIILRTEEGVVSQLRQTEARVRELSAQLAAKTRELDLAQEALRKLRAEYGSTRRDAEGMLAVLGGMERQLAEYAAREEQVAKLSAESRAQAEEARVLQEQCAVKEEACKRELDRLYAERAAYSAASGALVEQECDKLRGVYREREAQLERQLTEKSGLVAALQHESERARRDMQAHRDAAQRGAELLAASVAQLEGDVSALRQKLRLAVEEKEKEAQLRREMQEQNKDLRGLIDKLRLSADGLKTQLASQQAAARTADDASSGASGGAGGRPFAVELQRELQEAQRSVARLSKDLQYAQQLMAKQAEDAARRGAHDLQELQHKARDAEQLAASLSRELQQQALGTQEQLEALRSKARRAGDQEKARPLGVKIQQLEVRIEALRERERQWEARTQELRAEVERGERALQELTQQVLRGQREREIGIGVQVL